MLFDALRESNSKIVRIGLCKNDIDDKCMNSLADYLYKNPYVNEIWLGHNHISDKGIEILSEHVIGSLSIKFLDFENNNKITNASVPYFLEMCKQSYITALGLSETSISGQMKTDIFSALSISIDQRDIYIQSQTKSAAKLL